MFGWIVGNIEADCVDVVGIGKQMLGLGFGLSRGFRLGYRVREMVKLIEPLQGLLSNSEACLHPASGVKARVRHAQTIMQVGLRLGLGMPKP